MKLNHQEASLEKVIWSQVRKDVHKVNPELATILDEINPGEELPFYRAKYPFGVVILDKTQFYIPTPSHTIAALEQNDDDVSHNLYCNGGIPMGIVLDKSIELCISDETLMPWILMQKGAIFGLWRKLDPSTGVSYHMTSWLLASGMTSGFILPRISDKISYKKLIKARGLKRNMPDSLQEHSQLLSKISSHPNFESSWHSELLFFSNLWLDKIENYSNLLIYFQRYVIEKTAFWRNKVLFDHIWDSFAKILQKENIYVKPYIIDIVKHLIIVALGEMPGFSPAIDDEIAPVNGFQKDLLEIYGLKNFSSTIMVPNYFNMQDSDARPVYWSLQLPYYFESMPKSKTSETILQTLVQIHQLIKHFEETVEHGKLPSVMNTPIEMCLKRVKFTCFHSDIDSEGLIQHTHKLPKEDPSLHSFPIFGQRLHQQGFSETTPFTRGCVRISLKEKNSIITV